MIDEKEDDEELTTLRTYIGSNDVSNTPREIGFPQCVQHKVK
jgi:hypothetical protein